MAVIRDINRLKPNAQDACRIFLAECKAAGLNVLVTETLRTAERQAELYAQGRTKPGNIVTWTKKSRHQSGLAWDICKNVKGKEYSDTDFFKACGRIAKRLGITWGGSWKTPDMPHFEVSENWEVTNVEEIRKLREELDKIKAERRTYATLDSVPDWGRDTVLKLTKGGMLTGISGDNLDLSHDMLRLLVILDRSGTFDK